MPRTTGRVRQNHLRLIFKKGGGMMETQRRQREAFIRQNRDLIRAMHNLDESLQAQGLSFREGFFRTLDIKKRGGDGEHYFQDYVEGQAKPIEAYL